MLINTLYLSKEIRLDLIQIGLFKSSPCRSLKIKRVYKPYYIFGTI
jgi:hypothetical protein